MAKPKKKSGFSLEDINKFLVDNLVGSESLGLAKKAKDYVSPMGGSGNMVQQFGSLNMAAPARTALGKAGLLGEAAAKSNIADLFGIKDLYKFLEAGKPADAAYATMNFIPLGLGAAGKAVKKSAKETAAIANLLASYFRTLTQQ